MNSPQCPGDPEEAPIHISIRIGGEKFDSDGPRIFTVAVAKAFLDCIHEKEMADLKRKQAFLAGEISGLREALARIETSENNGLEQEATP